MDMLNVQTYSFEIASFEINNICYTMQMLFKLLEVNINNKGKSIKMEKKRKGNTL